jgi:hypothetical protein
LQSGLPCVLAVVLFELELVFTLDPLTSQESASDRLVVALAFASPLAPPLAGPPLAAPPAPPELPPASPPLRSVEFVALAVWFAPV